MTVEFERGKAYVVNRGQPKLRYGQGLAAGLKVVIRHFRDAFGKKLEKPSQTSGVFTVQYPEERMQLPEAFRNFPILLYDDATGHELCTSCFQCERICPPQVIHMTQAKDPTTGKPVPAVSEFLIEYDACMSCGLCAEVCPFDAIKMDHAFELATDLHEEMTINKQGLSRPVSYYEQLAPSFWGEAKDGAYKKLQGTMKRRSGLLGIAPQMAEKIRANLPPTPSAPTPATASQPVAPAPVAPAGADEKAARLAAIRAKNAAANAAPATPGEAAPTPDTQQQTTNGKPAAASADEKAARLAAIRAKNAAKKEPNSDTPMPTAVEAAAPTVPADEKAARLAAIRAANAAKKGAQQDAPGGDT